MLRSYWRKLISVVGLALLASSGQAQESENESERTADEKQESAEAFSIPIRIVESPEAADARQSGEREAEKREKEDLIAQQGMNTATKRMADYALWQTILIFVGTGALIYTLWLTRQANNAAWAAVDATKDVGKKQVRAYLGIESAKVEPMPGIGCYCFFYLKNYGQSPAYGIEIQTKIQFTITEKGKDWPTDKKIYRKQCNHPRTLAPGATGRCGVFIQDEMNAISEMNLSEIRFYCTAHIWWLDVFCTGNDPRNEQEAHIVMSQPLGTWTSEHWRRELDVGGSEESGSWTPRHTDLWLEETK